MSLRGHGLVLACGIFVSGCIFSPAPAELRSDGGGVDAGPGADVPEDGGLPDAELDGGGLDGGLGCGDGVRSPEETCDDGNRTPGDGCENNCQVTSGWQCDQLSPTTCERTPVITLTGTTATEGDTVMVVAELSNVSRLFPVRFAWETRDGTAESPDDFESVPPTEVVVPINEQRVLLPVATERDAEREGREVFRVAATAPVAATLGVVNVVVQLEDDSTPTEAGLVSRYYLDEGGGDIVIDDASEFDLTLTREMDQPSFYTDAAGGGLQWPDVRNRGAASEFINGSELQRRLDGATAATVEAVVDLDDVEGGGDGSFVMTITGGQRGNLTATIIGNGRVCLGFMRDVRLCWEDQTVVGTGRHVIAWVFQPTETPPYALYVDGVDQGAPMGDDPGPDAELEMPDGDEMVLGNRGAGDRAPEGRIGYLSIYDAALPPDDIARNAALLLVFDDP